MKKVIRTMVFMIGILLLSYSSSYAAVIQIKDTTAQVLTNATISDFYVMAEGLKGTGQALDGATVDVKMANNYEWAVVSYFSNSAYGTGGAGGNTGTPNINTGVAKHKSTNGNVTGVMDWGNNVTFTAGIIDSYATKTLTTEGNLTVNPTTNSIVNAAATNRVDKFNGLHDTTSAIAALPWYNVKVWISNSVDYPYSVRSGLFCLTGGTNNNLSGSLPGASGEANPIVTFRPVVWN